MSFRVIRELNDELYIRRALAVHPTAPLRLTHTPLTTLNDSLGVYVDIIYVQNETHPNGRYSYNMGEYNYAFSQLRSTQKIVLYDVLKSNPEPKYLAAVGRCLGWNVETLNLLRPLNESAASVGARLRFTARRQYIISSNDQIAAAGEKMAREITNSLLKRIESTTGSRILDCGDFQFGEWGDIIKLLEVKMVSDLAHNLIHTDDMARPQEVAMVRSLLDNQIN